MLTLVIPAIELFNDETNEFTISKEQTLQLEHSLVSLSKWESKWEKPFLTKEPKSREQDLDYIRFMTLTQNVDPSVYVNINRFWVYDDHIQQISEYIELPMTATILPNSGKTVNRETVTAELIYYWMITMGIPMECQKWHLNRLLTLINVCSIKNQPEKTRSHREILENNARLNNARRAAMNTKG